MKDIQDILEASDSTDASRIISFFGEVDPESIQQVIIAIQTINEEDRIARKQFLQKYPKQTPPAFEPIILDIQSCGGYVRDGLSLVSVIEQSEAPVHTRVNGYAYSMGFIIFLAGQERLISRHAEVMYHQISTQTQGTLLEIEEDMEISKRLQKHLEDYVVERCKVTKKDLQQIYRTNQDKYFSATESLELGIATKIV